MTRKYFGTDGIRGTVGQMPITPDFILRLGHAVGRVLRQTEARAQVLIGKDTRISGYMLESALESGFNSAGVDVLLLGPLPTPGVAYLTRSQRASLGVVISASHNVYADNGIKFFSANGSKLPDAWELAVEAMLEQEPDWVSSIDLGKARRLDDAAGRYIEFCKSTFASDLTLKNLKIVVDAANGAAYHIAPKVFHELGAEVISIGCSPDGMNINEQVGATHPQALQAAVLEHRADFGIALDGDADRLQIIDSNARLYNGDELLYVLAMDKTLRGKKPKGVVGTLMTNVAIELALQKQNIDFVRAKVGDRYVLEELQQRNWQLGGEGSGHLLTLDKHSTGDGLVSALQILQACVRAKRSLPQWLDGVSLYPQVLLNVRLSAQAMKNWQNNAHLQAEIQAVQEQLKGEGRVLIRASGTEPVLRVMVEAQQENAAKTLAQRLVEAAQKS